MQRVAIDDQRRRHRQLRRREFEGERMLLDDLRVAPAPGAVELRDHRIRAAARVRERQRLFESDAIDAVLVAVQGEQAPVDGKASAFHRVEHGIRGESRERQVQIGIPFTAATRQSVKIGG
jgi:hypothetical protein